MFNINHTALDSKIKNLSNKIDCAQPVFGSPSRQEWDRIFELCKNIHEDFKNVRYPSKAERDIAWQEFFNLRDKAHTVRTGQIYSCSKEHYDELIGNLRSADYDAIGNFIVGEIMTLGLLKITAEEMKAKGKKLSEIGTYFTSVKHEMTREHKAEVFEKIIEVRKNHDGFWERNKSYNEQKFKVHEEGQKAWQEKQEKSRLVKVRIESNLESNKVKLYKAKEALDRFEEKRDELKEKIYDSHSDNWKSKAEVWLDEFNDKIKSIEDQIEQIEKWIDEDKDKLRNWN